MNSENGQLRLPEEVYTIMNRINRSWGEHSICIRDYGGWGFIPFMFDYKLHIGEGEFTDYSEVLPEIKKLIRIYDVEKDCEYGAKTVPPRYYIRCSERRWLGDEGAVPFDDDIDSMKPYKTLTGAKKALGRAIEKCLAHDPEFYGVYTVDWSKPHCPLSKII